jgi:hypothetical protein
MIFAMESTTLVQTLSRILQSYAEALFLNAMLLSIALEHLLNALQMNTNPRILDVEAKNAILNTDTVSEMTQSAIVMVTFLVSFFLFF